MEVLAHAKEFHITIPFNHYKDRNLELVKGLSNRYFDGIRKIWIAPASIKNEVEELVKKTRAEFRVIEPQKPMITGAIEPLPELAEPVRLRSGELRKYQGKGVARGLELKRFINGDEQGLGKTLQSIATLYAAKLRGEDVFPALIICPNSTKINWQREWKQWTGLDALILNDKNKKNFHLYRSHIDVFIVNYESLKKFFVQYMPPKGKMRNSMDIQLKPAAAMFKSAVIDESHRCKNTDTQQTKLALRLTMGLDWIILLTGTPVINKPLDLWPQLCIMGYYKEFGGTKAFKDRYCNGGSGSANLEELNYLLNKKCFFRREKKDVAKDLPAKHRQTIICDITTRVEYNHARDKFKDYLVEKGCDNEEIARKLRGEIIVKLGELKRISALGKLNEVKEFVSEVLDSGQKLVLFCSLHSIVDAIKAEFPEAVTVTGRDNMKQKQASIDAFQNDPETKLVICNIKAAGVGITLTASSRVAFVEYPWTAADCVQCEDRVHRIGQTFPVTATYFLGAETIDEQLYEMIKVKAETANAITGASDKMETNYVNKMLNLFK
jgi:SWI/SNF-related matrix-associated actin-dependent regulator of chromatin subfamily A-like protein 1